MAKGSEELIGERQKVVQQIEKEDLEEALQALNRASDKGTSSAFRKIKKKGMKEFVEAGGVVKSYALHDQLLGRVRM